MSKHIDPTALSYWFPKIEAAGIPVPKTTIIHMSRDAQECMWGGFDGKDGELHQVAAYKSFCDEIRAAGTALGWPCFLRTDHTSNKHGWSRTCFLESPDAVGSHVFMLAEFSEICDFMGLPWDTWVVREFLPTIPLGVCRDYGSMPICREFRFFVDDGRVRCWHPYWPLHALEQGGAPSDLDFASLSTMANEAELTALAEHAGLAVGGSWSIDILETKRGWFVTDMAEAHKSFHWDGCPHADGKMNAAPETTNAGPS